MKYSQYENWEACKLAIEKNFTLEDRYVVCGAGRGLHMLLQFFPDVKIDYCLDAKAGDLPPLCWDVFPYETLRGKDVSNLKFLITASGEYFPEIKDSLLRYGACAENIISLIEVLFFWGTRYLNKTISLACNVYLLSNCNLRCKACAQFVPYARRFHYNALEDVTADLDQYFRIFDYVKELNLTGGETMLYRELGQVCAHIRTHYADRYHELKVFTNGLIIPKEAVIQELGRLERVHVYIDDYTGVTEKEGNRLVEYLEKYQVPYTFNREFGQAEENMWFDMGNPREDKHETPEKVQERFEKCSVVCQYLWDHKIYYCGESCCNIMGRLTDLEDEVCLDLDSLEQMRLTERQNAIGSFTLGYLDGGRVRFCQSCNGFGKDVNPLRIRAGEQAGC